MSDVALDLSALNFSRLEIDELRETYRLHQALENRNAQRLFYEIYPEEDTPWTGPSIMDGWVKPGQILYSRHKYPKHMEWLAAGAQYRERAAVFANRTGKSFGCGGFELALHLTGLYDAHPWWQGRRFEYPISAWAIGDTYQTTRDILQLTLLGQVGNRDGRKVMDGRGIIPGHLLGRNTWHNGVQDLVDTIMVKHVTGAWSRLQQKSSDQGRRSFQGTGRHVCWLDEECPEDVYGECLIRTATVDGIMMLTYTPIQGLTPLMLSFMPKEMRPTTDDDRSALGAV